MVEKKNKVKCAGCEEETDEDKAIQSEVTEEPVCECCYYEAEPEATVYYGSDGEPRVISSYRDETEGDFKVKWHSTDAWRGYYEAESDDWTHIADDNILAYSEDARELKKFEEELLEFLEEEGIEYARVFTRSSNLFSTGYDVFIKKEQEADAAKLTKVFAILQELKLEYRGGERYRLTALTGKDEFDEKDKLLSKATKLLEEGKDLEEVKEIIIEGTRKNEN